MLDIDFVMRAPWADAFQGLGTVAGALISLLGFAFVIRQMRYTRQAIETQTQAQIYNMGLDAYQTLIAHPELGVYFYGEARLPVDETERYRVFAAFEIFCDYFEYIILQKGSVSEDVRDSWMRYMTALFRRSPAMREFIEGRRDQYTPQFIAVYDRAVRSA